MVKSSCLPLLEVTIGLRYTLALKIQLVAFPNVRISMHNYMKMMQKFLMDDMREILVIFEVENFILLSFDNCNSRVKMFSDVYVYLQVYIRYTPYRSYDEELLSLYVNSTATWTLENIYFWKARIQPNQFALFLPSVLWKLIPNNKCWVLSEKLSHGDALYRNVLVDSLLTCPQVSVKNNAFGISWENIRFNFSSEGLSLSYHPFQSLHGNMFQICVRDIPYYITHYRREKSNRPRNLLQPIITIICIGISLICLVLTLITYATFKSLQTVPGLNNMFLISSLFLAQIILLVRQFTIFNEYEAGTIILSVATHFLWLSTFFWLQVCSFHMFLVFTNKAGLESRKKASSKIVVKYAWYAFGIPFGIVVLNMFVSFASSSFKETGYDKIFTLLTYKTAFIVTFIIPLILVCVTNLVFYAFTLYKIMSCPHIESTSGNKTHFSVYIKLFSITGLTWILQIIDTFLEVSILSYIVSVLNGLQGLFIFVSYVCNARVIKMWRAVLAPSNLKHA